MEHGIPPLEKKLYDELSSYVRKLRRKYSDSSIALATNLLANDFNKIREEEFEYYIAENPGDEVSDHDYPLR